MNNNIIKDNLKGQIGTNLSKIRKPTYDPTSFDISRWSDKKEIREKRKKQDRRRKQKVKAYIKQRRDYIKANPHLLWASTIYKLPNGDRVRYDSKGDVVWRNGQPVSTNHKVSV